MNKVIPIEQFTAGEHRHPTTGKSCGDMSRIELFEIIGMLLADIKELEDAQQALEDAQQIEDTEEIKIAVLAEADQIDEEIGNLKQRVKDIRSAFE